MAFLNLNVYKNSGLLPKDIFTLSMIKQIESEYIIENLTEEEHRRFETLNLIQHIKQGKKGEHAYKSLRLSKKAVELLSNLETPEIIDSDLKIYEWLKSIYLSTERELGNQKKTKLFIALFRVHSGIELNHLAFLCRHFIDNPDEFEWSKKLEFLLFKPSNPYEKFSIDSSRLYQYYLKQERYFLDQFSRIKQ